MVNIIRITEKEETKKWIKALTGQDKLPEFLYDDERYHAVVLGLDIESAYAGIAYGITESYNHLFFLHYIYIADRYRNLDTLLDLLKAIFREGTTQPGIKGIDWQFTIPNTGRNPYKILLGKLTGWEIEQEEMFYRYGMRTADLQHLRKHRWYHPQMLESSGCRIHRWDTYDSYWKEQIKERENKTKMERDYLPPFLENQIWELDSDFTFVLTLVATGEPLGWILCEKMSEKEVKIRRFYIYREARKHMLGPAFATRVLDIIAERYEYLYFDVLPGNRQMEMFTGVYCKPYLFLNSQSWNLQIKK